MLPDFPEQKENLERELLAIAANSIPAFAPLLAQVGRFRQHEGSHANLMREDGSTDLTGYTQQSVEFEIERAHLRRYDPAALLGMMARIAEDLARQHSRLMFQRIAESAEQVGNTINAEGTLTQEHFLELIRRVEIDFDPLTRKPTGQSFVMHPDTAAKVIPIISQWEKDKEFQKRLKIVNAVKWDEWRERESRRKLVD